MVDHALRVLRGVMIGALAVLAVEALFIVSLVVASFVI